MSTEKPDLRTWLEERETIHGKATEGPWHEAVVRYSADDIVYEIGTDRDEEISICRTERSPQATEDHRAIVDAHNTLPKLLAGVRAVLELHKPVESVDGDDLCSTCAEEGDFTVAMYWPCPTLEALQEAINDDE